jgi:hypothetical protein
MKDLAEFVKELLSSRLTRWVLAAYAIVGFATTIADQFSPDKSARLKAVYLLPKWHWRTWVILGLVTVVLVLLDSAHKLWKEKEKLRSTISGDIPEVILDSFAHRKLGSD